MMRPGLEPAQRPAERLVLLEELHAALWKSYVLGDASRGGSPSPAPALDELHDCWRRTTQLRPSELRILGTALWNLLDIYEKNDPPKVFTELLGDVMNFDLVRARELHAQPPYRVFPPLEERLMLDSSFTAGKDSTATYGAHASLMVSLERDFDDLRKVAYPTNWHKRCPLFWHKMQHRNGEWEGGLRLPERQVIDVVLKDVVPKNADTPRVDATKTQVSYTVKPNVWISAGRFDFLMTPEPSRPGWTRIVHDRSITFSSDLREREVPTLTYWTKSEIACLALG